MKGSFFCANSFAFFIHSRMLRSIWNKLNSKSNPPPITVPQKVNSYSITSGKASRKSRNTEGMMVTMICRIRQRSQGSTSETRANIVVKTGIAHSSGKKGIRMKPTPASPPITLETNSIPCASLSIEFSPFVGHGLYLIVLYHFSPLSTISPYKTVTLLYNCIS